MDKSVCVIGDLHGHLQLALGLAAVWHRSVPFDAVFLCGDLGLFTQIDGLDEATRQRAEANPCELEYFTQWHRPAASPWLAAIFKPLEEGGLGLTCPVVAIHGDRDAFELIAPHADVPPPRGPVLVQDLPVLDPGGYLRYLPSGWRLRLASGPVVGALGGIERRKRHASRAWHPQAFFDAERIRAFVEGGPVDLLLTHQGPAVHQGPQHGSALLDALAVEPLARVWCYSHCHGLGNIRPDLGVSVKRDLPILIKQVLAPGFSMKNNSRGQPGAEGWCLVHLGECPYAERRLPRGWQEFQRKYWRVLPDGRLVAPPLIPFVPASE